MAVQPIPDGYPRVSAYLAVKGAAKAIDYYATLLGAKERMRMPGPDGTIAHAELEIGDSMVMLADSNPDWGNPDPTQVGGSPVALMVYVEDVDAVYAAAIASGSTSEMEPKDHFYGDRSAAFADPFGHRWHVASHVEDVSPEEMGRRMQEAGMT